jgi:uncharacterized membrane protein YcjF (UPF0283 family)
MKTGVKPRNLLDVAKGNLYLLLLLAVGGMGIYESVRITHKYQPKNWLAGPSGFMMIVGCLLVAVFVFEVVVRCLRYPKGRTGEVQSAQAEASDATQTAEPQDSGASAELQVAESRIHLNNMYYSAGLLIVYTLLIRWLGFSISSCLYLLANMLLLKNSVKVTVVTVLAVLLYMLVGAPALGMSFPRGLLGI